MEFEFFNVNFFDIFTTVLFVIFLGIFSICLFFWFKSSSSKTSVHCPNNFSVNSKKKGKRKLNSSKSNKLLVTSEDLSTDKSIRNKHIEINSSPEILDESNKDVKLNIGLSPSKPILRKGDDEILVDEKHFHQSTWARIPKDEVEIRRSRQSSVVSETRSIQKEEIEEVTSKLSRGQKKRLKAKLKVNEVKIEDCKDELQFNNSSINDVSNDEREDCENVNISNKANLSKGVKKRLNKKLKNLSSNLIDSSLGNEKVCNLPSMEYDDKNPYDTPSEDFKLEEIGNEVEVMSHLNSQYSGNLDVTKLHNLENDTFVSSFPESEIQIKLQKYELENKEMKNEIITLKQKLNECSSMSSSIINLKKENEMYLKKQVDLDRTCSALQKELTNSIQKLSSSDNRLHRLTTERNQQLSIFDNEINKLNGKISMLEADNRAKTTENENLKMNLENLRHIVSEKDQLLQSQNNELTVLQDQCYKKRIDYQEIENINMKCKEMENQKQKLLEEHQKIKHQLEISNNEKQKEFEKFKIETKNKEREQNSLISSLQYQLDEFQKEKQFSMFNPEFEILKEENEKLKKLNEELKNQSNNNVLVPVGFELIELEKIKELTQKINEGNRKLQEMCDQNVFLKNQLTERETFLSKNNTTLEEKYSLLNLEREENLKEIVNLRKCIETLQSELTKNSDNNIDEMKVELDKKSEALIKTEEILTKLQSCVEEEEIKWKELLEDKTIKCKNLENENQQNTLLISNLNKKVSELTSQLQSNNCQFDSLLNGSLSVE